MHLSTARYSEPKQLVMRIFIARRTVNFAPVGRGPRRKGRSMDYDKKACEAGLILAPRPYEVNDGDDRDAYADR
jgi:hypothetical protein